MGQVIPWDMAAQLPPATKYRKSMLDAMDDAGVADVTYEMKEKKVKRERSGARLRPRGYLIGMIRSSRSRMRRKL